MDKFLRFFGLCRAADAEKQIWLLQRAVTRLEHQVNHLMYEVGNYRSACQGYMEQLSRLDEQIIH